MFNVGIGFSRVGMMRRSHNTTAGWSIGVALGVGDHRGGMHASLWRVSPDGQNFPGVFFFLDSPSVSLDFAVDEKTETQAVSGRVDRAVVRHVALRRRGRRVHTPHASLNAHLSVLPTASPRCRSGRQRASTSKFGHPWSWRQMSRRLGLQASKLSGHAKRKRSDVNSCPRTPHDAQRTKHQWCVGVELATMPK